MREERLVIIGTGPAGYTAAIYAARAELNPLVIEGPQVGGQLTQTTEVENWPGYPKGMMGPEMMMLFREQAERFGTRFQTGNVTDLKQKADKKLSVFLGEEEIVADAVIVATGASARWLGIEGENEYKGRGVSACATCDGFFFKEKKVFVVCGGDSAMEEANFLTKFAKEVVVLVRRDALKASKIMQERTLKNPKITIIWNSEAAQILGNETKMTGLKLKDTQTGEITEHVGDGLFIAIGHEPNTAPFKDLLEVDKGNYLVIKPGSSKTSVDGVFAAGDVADHVYRQAITAAGTGCMAALDAERYLAAFE